MKLDLDALVSQFREVEENEPQFDEKVNSYLLESVVPMVMHGTVTLDQIDLDQFDEEDPHVILRYFGWKEDLSQKLCELNSRLCKVPPACTKARAFL